MALHRKMAALMRWAPDVAVISECARPDILAARGGPEFAADKCVWVGENVNKGLGVFGFGETGVALARPHKGYLRHIAPVAITGAMTFNLLAVWAQNASGLTNRKHQLGPLRRALNAYGDFIGSRTIVGGDLNNNVFWDRPGWRVNHAAAVARLEAHGLVSAYHERMGEAQGSETLPTLYWRDRKKDGPRYHIDYAFLPRAWLAAIRRFEVGSFEDWCVKGLSDHAPLLLDLDPDLIV